MKHLFSRNRREAPTTQEPTLEARRVQEREENERFMRQLYANQDANQDVNQTAAAELPARFGTEAARPGHGDAEATGDAGVSAVPAAPPAPPAVAPAVASSGGDGPGGETAREGTRAALELLEVARQLLEGREDVESRVARQLLSRALELLPRVEVPPG